MYRSPDLLGVGWIANTVREKLHGNITYFNINRHINPTDVCVANCKLCAFGKLTRDGKAYTMSLDQIYHKAGEGYTEAVTEFHIVGGLHPELTSRLVLRDAARVEAAVPEGPLEGVHDGGDRVLHEAHEDRAPRKC